MAMVRIGVISDTHGLLRPEVAGRLEGCSCIVHAGDFGRESVLEALEDCLGADLLWKEQRLGLGRAPAPAVGL